jgi:geranylgeranyl pyrophosphate synthase
MIAAYQTLCQSRVDAALESLFEPAHSELARLYQAMRYSLFNGGKRVRCWSTPPAKPSVVTRRAPTARPARWS